MYENIADPNLLKIAANAKRFNIEWASNIQLLELIFAPKNSEVATDLAQNLNTLLTAFETVSQKSQLSAK